MASSTPMLVDEGGESDANAVLLGTRSSRHIPNQKRPEWHPDDLREALQMCLRDFPMIEARSVTAIYNCVGMVFATRRTWVEPNLVPTLLSDDGYRPLNRLEDGQVGDVAIYRTADNDIEHIGLIAERREDLEAATVSHRIMSKWGPWAEFLHEPDHVYSSYGELREIWTDRKQI